MPPPRGVLQRLTGWRTGGRTRKPLPLILLGGRLHDHQVFLLTWSVLLGATFAFGAPTPASLATSINRPVFLGWAATLAVSGVLGLLGCFWRGRLDVGLEIERAALLMQSGAWLLFSGCVIAYAGASGSTAAGICLAWALANLSRSHRINRALAADREQQRLRRVAEAEAAAPQ